MKVLLVNTNRYTYPDPIAPLGLATVAAGLHRAGHEYRVLDLTWAEDVAQAVGEACDGWAEVVGLSVRNIDNSAYPVTYSPLEDLQRVLGAFREAVPHLPLVLGGAGFSLVPLPFMERFDVDFGVVGEGEEAFPALLELLEEGGDPASLAGVLARDAKTGAVRVGGPAGRLAPEAIGGARWEGFPIEAYYTDGGMVNLQTKRGCRFKCSFCTYPLLEGGQERCRTPEAVADEIEGWMAKGMRDFFFVDSVFNYPEEQAVGILEEIHRRELNITWTCYLNPRRVSPRFAELAATTGCKEIEMGCDSASDPVLRGFKKGFYQRNIRESCATLKAAGIRTAVSLIFAGPEETRETVEETFAVMDELDPAAVIAMVGVRVYPGGLLHKRAVEEGQVKGEDTLLEPAFYFSPGLEPEDLHRIFDACKARGNWITPGDKDAFQNDMLERLRKKGLKGPLWRFLHMGRDGEEEAPLPSWIEG